jgi:aldehyde dehydrogenase (NAD+)
MGASRRKDLQQLLGLQLDFFRSGELRDLALRVEALKSIRSAIVERKDELLEALSRDLGKPLAESYMAEYVFTLQELDFTLKHLKQWAKPQRVGTPWYFMPARSWVEREAFGRVLIFGPWNYPFHLVMAPLISAIAAGNTVVVKPSEHCPRTAELILEMVHDALPPEHVSVVIGYAEVAQELLDCECEFIFFTGSTAVGKKVSESAGGRLIPTVLELGGKCSCVVDRDADLEIAADRILLGKWMNAGQTCVAPDYLLVHAEVKAAFLKELENKMRASLEGWNGMASMVHEQQFDRVMTLCEGEEVLRIGEDNRENLSLAPRVLPHCTWQSRVMQSEVFGPVLPVLAFSNIEDIPYQPAALATYVFSKSDERIEQFAQRLPSGGVCVNDTMKQMTNLQLPFGGVGSSGHGRYRGRWGFEAFSYPRAYTKRYFMKDPFQVLPPYERAFERLQKLFK